MKATLNRDRFNAAMAAKDLNMHRVALALDIPPPVVCQWRSGRHGPTLTNALRLCALLDVDPRELWTVHP